MLLGEKEKRAEIVSHLRISGRKMKWGKAYNVTPCLNFRLQLCRPKANRSNHRKRRSHENAFKVFSSNVVGLFYYDSTAFDIQKLRK